MTFQRTDRVDKRSGRHHTAAFVCSGPEQFKGATADKVKKKQKKNALLALQCLRFVFLKDPSLSQGSFLIKSYQIYSLILQRLDPVSTPFKIKDQCSEASEQTWAGANGSRLGPFARPSMVHREDSGEGSYSTVTFLHGPFLSFPETTKPILSRVVAAMG